MKKLLVALFLLTGLLLPAPAQAAVSCSVPFNLTNGTTADATQVMANYNAILTCLSTSAASSGANTDITSLGAVTSIGPLSTPITPAQGGAQALCGASGYKLINDSGSPNTEADISWSEAIVTNASGVIQRGTGGAVTLNFGTAGVANGLDAGSIGVHQIWYIWLIGNGSVISSLASLSPTTPTLPSGYTYKCRLSAIVTDDSSRLLPTSTLGNRTRASTTSWESLTTPAGFLWTNGVITCVGSYTATAMTGIPLTATSWIGSLVIPGSRSGFISSGPGVLADIVGMTNTGTGANFIYMHVEMPLYNPQTIYPCLNNAAVLIDVVGWVDSTNAN